MHLVRHCATLCMFLLLLSLGRVVGSDDVFMGRVLSVALLRTLHLCIPCTFDPGPSRGVLSVFARLPCTCVWSICWGNGKTFSPCFSHVGWQNLGWLDQLPG